MRSGVCKHYNGTFGSGRCGAGVRYLDLVDDEFGMCKKLPCFEKNEALVQCEKRTFPTTEEVEQFEKESQERFVFTNYAYAACAEDARSRGFAVGGAGMSGTVDCPKCGKKLSYSISGHNGRVWGRCETKDCLCWMQ